MKEDIYTSLICEDFCNYYNPGKETEMCGGYFYLKKFITPYELFALIRVFSLKSDENAIKNLSFICEECEFRVDGCDFFVDKSHNPCGGYLLISRLFKKINY